MFFFIEIIDHNLPTFEKVMTLAYNQPNTHRIPLALVVNGYFVDYCVIGKFELKNKHLKNYYFQFGHVILDRCEIKTAVEVRRRYVYDTCSDIIYSDNTLDI